jgi:hypothetical protein
MKFFQRFYSFTKRVAISQPAKCCLL